MKGICIGMTLLILPACSTVRLQNSQDRVSLPKQTELKIVEVRSEHITFDIEEGIRKNIRSADVYRMVDGRVVNVGTVHSIEFQDETAIARIQNVRKDYRIQVGDYLIMEYKSKKRMNVKEYIQVYARHGPDSSF